VGDVVWWVLAWIAVSVILTLGWMVFRHPLRQQEDLLEAEALLEERRDE
jgi:hypothetical protein